LLGGQEGSHAPAGSYGSRGAATRRISSVVAPRACDTGTVITLSCQSNVNVLFSPYRAVISCRSVAQAPSSTLDAASPLQP
jgi:hypothetical protein